MIMLSTRKWQAASATYNIELEPCVSTSIAQTLLCIFVLWRIPARGIKSYGIYPEWREVGDMQWHMSVSSHFLTFVPVPLVPPNYSFAPVNFRLYQTISTHTKMHPRNFQVTIPHYEQNTKQCSSA